MKMISSTSTTTTTSSTQLDSINEHGSNSTRDATKAVSFASVVKAKKVQHHNDMSPEEREYYWYDEEELMRIHVENEWFVTRAVHNGNQHQQQDESQETTTRGLERQIQEKATALGKKKTASIRKLTVAGCFNILQEQQEGCSPQELADKSIQCSLPNVLAARSTGVYDELAARDIYNDEESSTRSGGNNKTKQLLLGDTQECYNRATNLRDRRRQRMRRQIACKAA